MAGPGQREELPPVLDRHFVDIMTDCPYGLERTALYHQACLGILPDQVMGSLLAAGCRRNGNVVYLMRCPDCAACVPIRLRPANFRPDRGQRRCLARNHDVASGIAPLSMNRENLELLGRFLAVRFPAGGNDAREYYSGFFHNSITATLEIRHRVGGRLIGVSVVDIGDNWLNAVYFFFDPDEARRSPGTFNILYLAEFCRQHHLEYLYLGFWIDEVAAMRYKARYRPHEILTPHGWRTVQRAGSSGKGNELRCFCW